MIEVTRIPGADAGVGLGRPWFASIAASALKTLDIPVGSETGPAVLSIQLVDDAAMAALNETHLGCAGPTNVLGFESQDADEGLGQIALSLETARREAVLYGQEFESHCARLLVHAILHLAGFGHGEDMEAETDRILAGLAETL